MVTTRSILSPVHRSKTTLSDAQLARIVQLMWSHGISNARTDGGDSPGSSDYIRIVCGPVVNFATGESYGDRRWQVCVYWAHDVMAEGSCEQYDLGISAWTEDADGNKDSHTAAVIVPFSLDPNNEMVLDACEAIIKFISDNGIPLSEVPSH